MNKTCVFLKSCFWVGVFNWPVGKEPQNATDKVINEEFIKMRSSFQSQIKSNKRSLEYKVEGSPDLASVMIKFLTNDGCENVQLKRNTGGGPQWDYTSPSVTISFLNPEYETHLQKSADFHVKSIEQRLKTSVNLDQVVSYSMADDIDLANQVKKMLEKRGYEKVVLKRSEGSGPQWDYTSPSVTISFANPIYKTYGLE